MLAFSLTTNPHLRLTLKQFWLNPYLSSLLTLVKTKTSTPHVTFHMTFLQLSSTCRVESIKHLFRAYPKAKLFGMPNHRSIIIWCNTQLWPFKLSISPRINLVVLLALSWPFIFGILLADLWNFNKTKFCKGIGYKDWVISIDILCRIYAKCPDNWEFFTTIEYISQIGGDIPPMMIITKIQQLVLWFNNNLSNDITVTTTKTGYTNN